MWKVVAVVAVVLTSPGIVSANGAAPRDEGSETAIRDQSEPPELVPSAPPADLATGEHQLSGIASWYGGKFHGRLTANGETFNTNDLTAAHRTLPFDTIVRVTNLDNNRAVVVRINDRGPFVDNRVIDLSRASADIIGLTAAGIAPVQLEILHYQHETDLRTVQVGSFSERRNAQAALARLNEAGVPAAIETAADVGVHRVIVQGIPEDEIPALRNQLANLGYRSILVRRK